MRFIYPALFSVVLLAGSVHADSLDDALMEEMK
jgi:hypothetical protein